MNGRELVGFIPGEIVWSEVSDDQMIDWAKIVAVDLGRRNSVLRSFGFEELGDLYKDDGSLKEGNDLYNPAYALALWDLEQQRMFETGPLTSEKIARIDFTEQRILRAISDYYLEEGVLGDGNRKKFGFMIPSRDYLGKGSDFEDMKDFFPAFYDCSDQVQLAISSEIPPFMAAAYTDNGIEVGYTIYVPFLQDNMTDLSFTGKIRYIRERIFDAVKFAYSKYKVTGFGLGGIMGMATYGGEILKDMIKKCYGEEEGIDVTTGHGNTTYMIPRTIENVVENSELDMSKLVVSIVGCGYIGESSAKKLLSSENPKMIPSNLVLTDKKPGAAEQLRKKLIQEGYNGDMIIVVESNEKALGMGDVIISATTNEIPEIGLDELPLDENGDIKSLLIIDDSQPPLFKKEVLEDCNVIYLWPNVKARGGTSAARLSRNGYHYGPNGVTDEIGGMADFSCGGEISVLFLLGLLKDQAIIGEVTPAMSERVGKLVEEYGYEPTMESYGQRIPINKVKDVVNRIMLGK